MLADITAIEVRKLTKLAQDESLPAADRRDFLAQALVLKCDTGSISSIQDQDIAAVAQRISPWPMGDPRTLIKKFYADGDDFFRFVDGRTLVEAVEIVAEVRAYRKLLATVIDESLSADVRLAAIKKLNPGRDPQTLRLVPETATRLYTSAQCEEAGITPSDPTYTRYQVARPPLAWTDVFAL